MHRKYKRSAKCAPEIIHIRPFFLWKYPYIYKRRGSCFAARPLEECAAFPGYSWDRIRAMEVRLYRRFYNTPYKKHHFPMWSAVKWPKLPLKSIFAPYFSVAGDWRGCSASLRPHMWGTRTHIQAMDRPADDLKIVDAYRWDISIETGCCWSYKGALGAKTCVSFSGTTYDLHVECVLNVLLHLNFFKYVQHLLKTFPKTVSTIETFISTKKFSQIGSLVYSSLLSFWQKKPPLNKAFCG